MDLTVDLTLPSSNMLSFDVANGMMQTNCLTVTATEDNIFEDTETFTLSLSSDVQGVSIVDQTTTTVSIIDNDSMFSYRCIPLLVYMIWVKGSGT